MNTNVSIQMGSEILNISKQICGVSDYFSKVSAAIRVVGKAVMKRISQDLVHANEIELIIQEAHQDRLRISALGYRHF